MEEFLSAIRNAAPLFNAGVVAILAYIHGSYAYATRRPVHFFLASGWMLSLFYLALEIQNQSSWAFQLDLFIMAVFLIAASCLDQEPRRRLLVRIAILPAFLASYTGYHLFACSDAGAVCWKRFAIGSSFACVTFLYIGLSLRKLSVPQAVSLFEKPYSAETSKRANEENYSNTRSGHPDAAGNLNIQSELSPGVDARQDRAPMMPLEMSSDWFASPPSKHLSAQDPFSGKIDISHDSQDKSDAFQGPRRYIPAELAVIRVQQRAYALARRGRGIGSISFGLFGLLQLFYPFHAYYAEALHSTLFLAGTLFKAGSGLGFRSLIAAQGKTSEAKLRRAEIEVELARITAAVEHDMRGPLEELGLTAELMTERSENVRVSNPKGAAFLKRVGRNLEAVQARMRIVMGMILAMRATPASVRRASRRTNIGAPVRRAIANCKAVYRRRPQQMPIVKSHGIHSGLDILASEMRVTQIFVNLINNAIEASLEKESGKRPRILVRSFRETVLGVAYVTTEVVDAGIGIKPDRVPLLISATFSTKRSDDDPNRGIGLFVADKIARLHGGRIEIRSELGEGTTVAVRMPAFTGTEEG